MTNKKFNKLLVLMWKNWKMTTRAICKTVGQLGFPLCCCVFLILCRQGLKPLKIDSTFFNLYDPSYIMPRWSEWMPPNPNNLAYAPCNIKIGAMLSKIKNFTVFCYNTEQELEERIADDRTYIGGVQFDNKYSVSSDQPLGNELSIKFRFPSPPDRDWFTENIYEKVQKAESREYTSHKSSYGSSYFLGLQIMFAKAYAETALNVTDFPKVLMKRFPHPEWFQERFYHNFFTLITFLFYFFMFVWTFLSLIEPIVTEKENQLKESMKIMGLPSWMHWLGWFLQTFLVNIIIVLIITILLTQLTTIESPAVFTYAPPSIIFVLFVLYVISLICFTFLVSTFFQKASTAVVFGTFFYLVTMIPFFLVSKTGSKSSKIGCSLFSNSAFGFGIETLTHYEMARLEYLNWNNIFKTKTSNDLSVGIVCIMLSMDSFIYLLLTLYIEALFPGDFGVSHKWYFPFTRSYWCGEKENIANVGTESKKNVSEFVEEASEDLHVGIQLKNLSKNFGSNKVVKQLNLDIYEGQITILLGHNGAGKTTTMCMIIGMFSPSSGTANVGGYNVKTNIERVRDSVGLCLQHNVLFNRLTVEEHLYFFGKLKGLNNEEIKLETDTYLQLLELEDKRKAYSCTLSGGMKRKLSVAISLCGGSKIVILDEPTAGMDPAARRTVWEVLQKQKKERTILLTTHYMDEADLLGDRIAIMCDGEVKCVGSSFFLKKKYGSGYYLVMEAQPNCDVNEVTNMLKRHISTVKLNSYIGSELSYLLSEREVSKFEGALADLEKRFKQLKINGYGLSLANMEEVFMEVGADQKHHNKPETKLTLEESIKTELNTGMSILRNHCEAMTIKKYKSTLRSWALFLFQILMPIITITILLISSDIKPVKSFPPLLLTLKSYPKSTTLLSGNQTNEYYKLYKQLLSEQGHHIHETANIENVIMSVLQKTPAIAKNSYIVGATFEETSKETKIIAWYNGDPYHADPLSLQLVLNTILRKSNNKTFIQITNHPLRLTKITTKPTEKLSIDQKDRKFAAYMGAVLSIVVGFFAMFPAKERITRSKHLQIVSGIHIALYWVLAYFWDMVIFLVNIILIMLILLILKPDGFTNCEELRRLFVLLICFGLSFLPFVYLISKLVNSEAIGFSAVMVFSVACSFVFYSMPVFKFDHKLDTDTFEQTLIIPFYIIIHAIHNLYVLHMTTPKTSKPTPRVTTHQPIIKQGAVEKQKEYFSLDFESCIGWHVIILLAMAVICFALLLLSENTYLKKIIDNQCLPKIPKTSDDLEEDVGKENETIRTMSKSALKENYTLVLKDVTKFYRKFLAVNNLCLGVKPYECFGLLGVNGAGKTTTFQMMTGDETMTNGEAWVNGFSVNKQLKKVHQSLGYCPQNDALLPDLTARETLLIFALIRGVPHKDCRQLAENLAIQFDFFQHLDKKTKQLSGGNKRKLSTALALIGNPTIIFLDEPTAGMDPATRRFLWQVLCKVRDSGKTIILTSHSMEECEALCTRLAIMVNGKFECIGSSQRLKNKFAQGYTVTIKLKEHKNAEKLQREAEDIEKFVMYQFTGATLQDKHKQLMTFIIPSTSIQCSAIFGILEHNKSHLHIEDYTVGQSSLEQIFLNFTKIQKEK